MKKNILTIILIIPLFSSYGQTKLFVDPEFSKYGSDHEIIAVIPFQTTISTSSKKNERIKRRSIRRNATK